MSLLHRDPGGCTYPREDLLDRDVLWELSNGTGKLTGGRLDYVRLYADQTIAADLLKLWSSDTDATLDELTESVERVRWLCIDEIMEGLT